MREDVDSWCAEGVWIWDWVLTFGGGNMDGRSHLEFKQVEKPEKNVVWGMTDWLGVVHSVRINLFLASSTRAQSLCFWCLSPKMASTAWSQRLIRSSRFRLKAWAMRRYSLLNLLWKTPTSSVCRGLAIWMEETSPYSHIKWQDIRSWTMIWDDDLPHHLRWALPVRCTRRKAQAQAS